MTGEVARADEVAQVEQFARHVERIREQIGRVIVGQRQVIELLLISLFCRGHSLFVGVPGLAKTMLVSTLSRVLSLRFSRIQFTPDLMPADITGTDVLEQDRTTGERFFKFIKGPVFANIILADEINRTPPKTQAALLESMQEYRVTAGGTTYCLEQPFHVFATQNPIEQEGTYPLPEAQLDRFMFQIDVDYPSEEEEVEIVKTTTVGSPPELEPVMGPEEILRVQELVRRVPVSDYVVRHAVRIVRASRPHAPQAPPRVAQMVNWGAGPRACQYLILGAKARAVLPSPTSTPRQRAWARGTSSATSSAQPRSVAELSVAQAPSLRSVSRGRLCSWFLDRRGAEPSCLPARSADLVEAGPILGERLPAGRCKAVIGVRDPAVEALVDRHVAFALQTRHVRGQVPVGQAEGREQEVEIRHAPRRSTQNTTMASPAAFCS